jgi:hypothetical protein
VVQLFGAIFHWHEASLVTQLKSARNPVLVCLLESGLYFATMNELHHESADESSTLVPLLFPWWNPVSLDIGQCWQYVVGPLALYFRRNASEWQFGFDREQSGELQLRTLSNSMACLPDSLLMQRFIFRSSPQAFCLKPKLLDRSVVVKTRQPVSIPPGEQSVFYISSPVCIELQLQKPDCVLQEIPVQRLSDTWFGPSTQEGELCYADRTQARHNKSELPLRPHRAVTPITIVNNAARMLTIDKLSIPVPYLAIYGLPDGSLWTDPIVLEHNDGEGLARFRIDRQLPEGIGPQHQLGGPRLQMERHGLVRAFTHMFGN